MAAGDVARFGALAAMLAILVGLVLALLGLLHMGFVSRFISAGVQAGFMFGLGLSIIVGQVPKLLGVSGGEGSFFPQLGHLLTSLDEVNGWTAAIGLGSVAVLLAAKRAAPTLPAALAVVVAGIAVVALFGLAGHGVEVIGRVEGAMPGLVLPGVGWSDLVALLPGAMAIAVIGYAESATVAESLADEHGYTVRPDRELLAIGGANTQLVSLLVSGLTVLTAVALLPLFSDLPQAVLGAIVIAAVAGFLNLAALRRIARLRRASFVLAMVALAGVLIFGVLGGLLLAVVISILLLLDRQSRPGSTVRTEPGLLVFRLDAPPAVHQRQAGPGPGPGAAGGGPGAGAHRPARPPLHPRPGRRGHQRAGRPPRRAGRAGGRTVAGQRPRPRPRAAAPQRPGRHRRRGPPLPRPGRRRSRRPGRPRLLITLSATGGCGRRTPAPCGSWAPGGRWR